MRLTKQNATSIPLPAGQSEVIHFDDKMPGFGLRIRAGAPGRRERRTWIAQYRIGKKQRRETLGTVEKLDADKARAAAKTALAKVQLGGDPQAEKIKARASAANTLDRVARLYLDHLRQRVAAGAMRPRSYAEVERHLIGGKKIKGHWAPLNGHAVNDITRTNIKERLAEIAQVSGPVAANRARSTLSALYAWAMGEDGIAEANPVVGTSKTDEQSGTRVLTDAELVDVWAACRDDDHGRIVRMLILTGQRREEIGGMAAVELDMERRMWTIPCARTKNGNRKGALPHDVPLADAAIDIISAAPRRADRDRLFGAGEGSFSGWSGAKEALDERILQARLAGFGIDKPTDKDRAKCSIAPPWRIHDIRRTVATGMANIGILPHVIEAVLNHISGHKAGVAGIYNRSDYKPEKRQALDRWAAHVAALIEKRSNNIFPMVRESA